MPAREDYWRLHAWTAQVVQVWIWSTIGLWLLLGPIAVPIVAVPVLAWYRRRAGMAVLGLETTDTRLTLGESYRARAEGHTFRSLMASATLAALAMTIALGAAVARPESRLSAGLAGLWFAATCAVAGYMLSAKRHSTRTSDAKAAPVR